MSKPLTAALAVLVLVWAAACVAAQTAPAVDPARGPRVVHVAPPTGDMQTDRASILAALERVRPGGTVQFAPGTYLLGGFIPVSVSGVTLLGHPNRTTLRGCDPADRSTPDGRVRCNTLALVGSRQVVRNLTFDYMSWGLTVGFVIRGSGEGVFHAGEGGHLIEGNTFRDSYNGVRAAGDWPEPVVVRGNRFINTYHAGDIVGRRVHFLDNDISAPDPTRLTPFRHVGGATQITPLDPVPGDVGLSAAVDCEENVIAGNRYDGHPDAIVMYISREGSCRNNVIRDNTIIVRRARFFGDRSPGRIRHETDSTLVGIPLVLADWSEEYSTESRGVIENNLIEGNRIIGAEGLGIMLHRASRNRVADNTITGIRRREPFPGNVLWGIHEEQWRHANGSAIWVSPGSDGNEIIGNTFEDVAAAAVVIEGDSNQVELKNADDAVRDLGRANRVHVATAPPQAAEEVRARTNDFLAALSDDSPTFVSPFYAPDAVLVPAGEAVLEGRRCWSTSPNSTPGGWRGSCSSGACPSRRCPRSGTRTPRYPAQHLRVDMGIDIPALVLLNESEASSLEDRWEMDLQYARWVAAGELAVPDSATRAYFLRLARDEAAQAEVRGVYRDLVAPAHRAADERFRRAFGDHLRLIPLEERAIGYGYREAPELIEPHIRRFLDEVSDREQRRSRHPAAPDSRQEGGW